MIAFNDKRRALSDHQDCILMGRDLFLWLLYGSSQALFSAFGAFLTNSKDGFGFFRGGGSSTVAKTTRDVSYPMEIAHHPISPIPRF